MSAVGAEYAEVRPSLHQCTAATSWAHCPHGAVSPVTALPGPRLETSIKKITGLFSCKQLFDIKITDKNIKTELLAENTELVVQK